jgi:hypothetical protein
MPETFPTFSLTSRGLKPILRQISVIVPGNIEIPVFMHFFPCPP